MRANDTQYERGKASGYNMMSRSVDVTSRQKQSGGNDTRVEKIVLESESSDF